MPNGSDSLQACVALAGEPSARVAVELALPPNWVSVVALAASLGELLAKPPAELHVVVYAPPGGDTVEADDLEALRRRFPVCRLVLVGQTDTAAAARAAIRAGAEGYVAIADLTRCLPVTVAAVLAGQICMPREARLGVVPAVLSHRERQILQLAAAGLTNAAIAARLYLSQSTVKTHLSSGFRKLGVASRAEAALALEMFAPAQPVVSRWEGAGV